MLRRAAQQLGSLQAGPSTSGAIEPGLVLGRLCAAWAAQGFHSSAAASAKAPAAGGGAKKAKKGDFL